MSFNGSGTFQINSTGQPVVSGTVISSSVFNALTADLATGLSTCITKDGQTTVTANISLNGYKITGLAAGTAATDAARVSQLQAGGATLVTVTGTDTYTGTMSPSLAAYAAGNTFTFVVPNTNTTSCTLNIDGLGAKALTRDGSTALVAGDLVAGAEVAVVYDGTRFQVLNSNSKTNFNLSGTLTVAGNTTLSGGTANGVAYLNGSKVLTTGSALTFDGTNLATTGSLLVGISSVSRSSRLRLRSSGSTSSTDAVQFENSAGTQLGVWRDDGYVALPTTYNNTSGSAANIYMDASGFLYRSTSSLKYKKDVQTATHGLAELLTLRPVTYKSKSETDGDKVFGGLIAEEVHAAGLTEFVVYGKDDQPDALHYGNMVSLCIKAMQEQQFLIESLTARLNSLENK